MESELVGPDGKPIVKPEQIPVVKTDGRLFPIRTPDLDTLFQKDPKTAMSEIVYYMRDVQNLIYAGMTALARDVYSRQPVGTRHFKKFAEDIGLQLVEAHGEKIVVALDCLRK